MVRGGQEFQESDEHLHDAIVDRAIEIAEDVGWENVRLHDVADTLGISLAEISMRFRDLDAIADAWFRRARSAMLAPTDDEFVGLPANSRLKILMLRWFDALAPRRRVTVEMLAAKMWPFHPHHWAPMVFNLSRTILWLRDAAGLTIKAPRRQAEEVGLTMLFLATLSVWARDDSIGQERTRQFLDKRLGEADLLMWTLCRGRREKRETG